MYVYMICDTNETERYIGSTKETLARRMGGHRYNYRKWKDGKQTMVSVFELFDKYGLENCKIVLLEEVNTDSRQVLLAREHHYITSLECVNKKGAIHDKKAYAKNYRESNKDKLRSYFKAHYQSKKALTG